MVLHKGLRIAAIIGLSIFALSDIARPAYAACTSPAGIAGGITWNGTDSVIWCDGTNWYALKNAAGAAGSTGQVQFNDGSGAFAADSGLTWDNTNKTLTLGASGVSNATTPSLFIIKSGTALTPPANVSAFFQSTEAAGSNNFITVASGNSGQAGLIFAKASGSSWDSWGGVKYSMANNAMYFMSSASNIATISSAGFSLDGEAARTIGMERTTGTNGLGLTIRAGGAKSATADLNGGHLYLTSGTATGTGSSNIYFQTATPQATTNTTDNAPTTAMTIMGNGNVGIGTAIVRYPLHVGAGTAALTAYTGNSIDTFTPQIVAQPSSGVAGVGAFVNNGTNNRRATLFMNDTNTLWGLSQANTSGGAVPFIIRQYNTGEVLRIDSSGNVGIGTTSPQNLLNVGSSGGLQIGANTDAYWTSLSTNQLQFNRAGGVSYIRQQAIGGALRFTTSNVTANDTDAMHIAANGNVGIGTTTPSGTLYVKGNTVLSDDTANVTASYPLRVYSASSSSGLVNLYYQNADVNGAILSLQKYKSGGNEIAAGDILGSIDFFGTTGAGNSLRAAQIRATAETGWGGTGDAPGRLTFWTTPDGSSTAVERMRIDNAGNVGIGTTSPSYKLHVTETRTDTSAGNVVMTRDDLNVNPGANSASTFIARMHRADIPSGNGFNITGAINSASNYTTHTGTGTVAVAYGSSSLVDNLSATGIITNATGANNAARGNSAGTITGAYGASNIAHTMNAAATMTSGYGAYNASQTTLGTMTNGFGSYDAVLHNAPTTMAVARGSTSAISVGSGATVTTAYGVYTSLSNAGTVGSWYGLYVPASTGTAPTTNRYPVYVVDTGSNYFAGNVGIGTSTPAAKLDVNGFMRLAKNGSAPATCDATIDGAIALTSARRMCVCDATSWKEVNSATACTW